ncbi:MAG: cupin domain-containing protein [Myxococcales bacterium]|nr:cupin domain-containing protein [Myxococcales bacterium]
MTFDPVTRTADAPVEGGGEGPWSASWRVLTPHMRDAGGTLGVVENTLPPGAVGCPFHWHLREDEVFYVLSGRGRLRYGDTVRELGPDDCVSCPAGTEVAHQLANPYDAPFVYLAIGPRDPHEVCTYPDSGKVMVRGLRAVGYLERADYMAGEPDPPVVLSMDPEG